MSEKDTTQKELFNRNDVFADVLNTLLNLDKNEVINPEDLSDVPTFSSYKAFGKIFSQERDVAKRITKLGITVSLIGYEFQSKKEPNMPVCVMSYDAANYRVQLRDNQDGKLYPVITIVLYFGKGKWTGNRHLLSRLQLDNLPPKMRKMVSDYEMKNLIDLSDLTREQVEQFKSSFQFVACRLYQVAHPNAPDIETAKSKTWKKEQVVEAIDATNALAGKEVLDVDCLERQDLMDKTEISLAMLQDPYIEYQSDKKAEVKAENMVVNLIYSATKSYNVTVDKAMEDLHVEKKDRPKYKAMVEKLQKEQSQSKK